MFCPGKKVFVACAVPLLICLCAYHLGGASEMETASMVMNDRELLAPGVGADMFLVGESFKDAVARTGKPGRVARFAEARDIFGDVLGIKTDLVVRFDRLHHYTERACTIFTSGDRVVAVSGTNGNRATPDGVPLGKGISYFILHYGNRGCEVLVSEKNRLYIYRSLGIALADDGDNGSIDLYIVFIPQPPAARR